MKKMILLVVMLTLTVFVSGTMAQQKPAPAAAPAKMEKFSGAIKSADAMAKSIVVAKGKEEKTFAITDDTKITKGKETLKFEDLKAGMNVAIGYKKEMDKMMAEVIKVYAPKAPKKK
jgi:outer membrane lipoprotein-sorting protein